MSKRILNSLDKLHFKTKSQHLDLANDKWIIFSDHHRGIGDAADDFAPCKETYMSALNHYLKNDFGLIILGDAEEFWENTLKSVLSKYKDVLELEKRFYKQGRLVKIWGNHDDAWGNLQKVTKYLFPFFNNIETHEAIAFDVFDNEKPIGNIFLVHGHQGNAASDMFSGISKWFVRNIWRNLQRWFKIPLSTPSKSKELRDAHDITMHTWAKTKPKQLIICGHTHQPVFMSRNPLDALQQELDNLNLNEKNSNSKIAEIQSKIDALKVNTAAIGTIVTDRKPCYFNSGCCSFSSGDITGLEIEQGKLSLVKWSNCNRISIEEESIKEIFEVL